MVKTKTDRMNNSLDKPKMVNKASKVSRPINNKVNS